MVTIELEIIVVVLQFYWQKIKKKRNKKEKEYKNNLKSHSKYKHTKQGNFIKIFKGSIVILNDKEGMCNFSNLKRVQ